MVRTHLTNHEINQNAHNDAGTSNNPQANIDLLNKKITRMEKDLVDKDTALNGRKTVT
jgi:hypothetical protein